MYRYIYICIYIYISIYIYMYIYIWPMFLRIPGLLCRPPAKVWRLRFLAPRRSWPKRGKMRGRDLGDMFKIEFTCVALSR